MGGTEASRETDSPHSSLSGAQVVQKLPHAVFGNILVCNVTFKSGLQSAAYKKEVLIDSSELGKKLLDYSKLQELEPLYNELFLTIYGYQLDRQAVRSPHAGHVRQQHHRQHLLRALRRAAQPHPRAENRRAVGPAARARSARGGQGAGLRTIE